MFRKFVLLSVLAIISATAVAAQTRTRPAAPKPAASKAPAPAVTNLKITYKQTTAGQTMESTTMLKGKRERSETRSAYMDSVSITQCDLKRSIQVNNKSQKYLITPMETVTASQTATSENRPGATTPTTKGGVVTYWSTAVDTGERKEMFGFTARHIKTSLKIESSPDACSPMQQRMETDGWYIDLTYGLECEFTPAQTSNTYGAQGGCRDRTVFKRTGAARTGYALSETTTMYGADGNVVFTTSKEVVDISRDPLDAALFDLPAGYTEAKDSSELYATTAVTSQATSMANAQAETNYSNSANSANAESKAPGVVRVGVVTINNRSGKSVSVDSLRDRLVGNIQGAGVEAVALNAISQTEAEIEAKTKQCDFILYTDISALKSSAAKKIGGMFSRAVGGGGGVDQTEAKVDFKLFKAGESSPRLQASSAAKQEGDEASAGAAIDSEAKQVSEAVRRK